VPAPYNGIRINRHQWTLEPVAGSTRGGIRAPGLVGCYLFNNGASHSTSATRLLNEAVDGEVGTILNTTAASWQKAAHGFALDFAPSGPVYVELGTPTTQKSIHKNYSILARLILDDDSADRVIYSQASGGAAHQNVKSLIVMTTTRKLRLYGSDSTGAEFFTESSALTVPLSTWTVVGAAMDKGGDNVTFYVDGSTETIATATTVSTTPDTTATIRIGYTARGLWSHWDGRIDWLLIWNTKIPLPILREVHKGGPWGLLRPHPRMQFPQDPIVAIIQSVDTWRYKPIIMWRPHVRPLPYMSWEGWPVPEAPISSEGVIAAVLDSNYGVAISEDAHTYDAVVVEGNYGAAIESR